MSTGESNPGHQLAQHPFLKALATAEIWAIVQGVLARNCAVLLLPEKDSLEGLIIDDLFALTHCAFLNPLNPTEVVTANGLVAVLGRASGMGKQLYVVSDKGKVNTKDPTQTFDVIRPLYTQFSQELKTLQTVPVLSEQDITLNKRSIKTILLASPVNFPGNPWRRSAPASIDQLINFSSKPQITTSTSPLASPIKSTKSAVKSTSTPTSTTNKARTGSEEAAFLTRLKSAPEVHAALTDFITKFVSKTPAPGDQGNIVRAFLDDVTSMMAHHRAWTNASIDDMELAAEAAEKYIMLKIYKFCFSNTTEDIARDKALQARFSELQFITPDHLDIAVHHRDPQRTEQAISELRQINTSKTPRGKLTRILNCCKAIYAILNRASQQGQPSGADEFFPLLNYVVLKANPTQLHSNIQFILRFRAPNKMITEAGYYFTHLETSITWLETVDASKLTIEPDVFNSLLRQSQEAIQANNAVFLQQKQQQQQQQQQQVQPLAVAPIRAAGISASSSSNIGDLLDISGLSPAPSPAPSPMAASLFSELVWHSSNPNNSSTSPSSSPSVGAVSTISTSTLSRPSSSSGSRSATRDDESSEASVLELPDAESPLRFLNARNVDELKVGELEELFQAYRMLAHENYQLRTDLYRSANKFGPSH